MYIHCSNTLVSCLCTKSCLYTLILACMRTFNTTLLTHVQQCICQYCNFPGYMHALYMQVNAILLTISLVSLAKSQCRRVVDDKKDKQAEQYLEVGK